MTIHPAFPGEKIADGWLAPYCVRAVSGRSTGVPRRRGDRGAGRDRRRSSSGWRVASTPPALGGPARHGFDAWASSTGAGGARGRSRLASPTNPDATRPAAEAVRPCSGANPKHRRSPTTSHGGPPVVGSPGGDALVRDWAAEPSSTPRTLRRGVHGRSAWACFTFAGGRCIVRLCHLRTTTWARFW